MHIRRAHPAFKPAALAVAVALAAPRVAIAGPVGATVVSGQAQVMQPDARTTLIRQDSDKAIINWRSFSIGAGQSVQFQQPGSASVALNRVTTATPSEIYGSLSANGKVFLVNSSGILFGKDAAVDVGSLVASTLDIADDDFLAGRYRFADGGGAGAVRNQGRLSAAERGTIALLGAQVGNDGTISARLGSVGLAAGGKVTLDFSGDGLTAIVVDAAIVNALVENGGAVLSEGGQVTMTARALGALADTVIRNSGVVGATSLVEREGRIVLDGGAGKVDVAGTMDASGRGTGAYGGTVDILGRALAVAGGATIDASGDAGGGTVLVGGGERGAIRPLARATSTTLETGSTIRADALGSGDGGTIVLSSDSQLATHGTLSARGGPQAGNGGFIETSGRRVDISGLTADASSARGKAGAWLLDPDDFTIGASEAAVISAVLDTGTEAIADSTGSITVGASIRKSAATPTDATLTLNAARDIIMYGGPTISSTSGRLHVNFNANAAGRANPAPNETDGTGAIVIAGGSQILSNGGDILLYGQSDALNGRAIGHDDYTTGIRLSGATLDTRSADGAAGGRITLRGAGADAAADGWWPNGGAGIEMSQSTLRSAAGGISLDGHGGMGQIDFSEGGTYRGASGTGVRLDLQYGGEIASTSGAISVVGNDGGDRISADPDWPGRHAGGASGLQVFLGSGGRIASGSGSIALQGNSDGMPLGEGSAPGTGLWLSGGRIESASGSISITGTNGAQRSSLDTDLSGGGAQSVGLRATLDDGAISSAAGSVTLRGDSYTASGFTGSGVGTAVSMYGGRIDAGNRLEITGIARQDTAAGLTIDGAGGSFLAAGAGGMFLAGRGTSEYGLSLWDVAASTTAGGTLSIAGQATGGIGVMNGYVALGGEDMAGAIVVRALNDGTSNPMLGASAGLPFLSVRTSGVTALLPGGVDDNGAPTMSVDTPIHVGIDRTAADTPLKVDVGRAGEFNVSLAQMRLGLDGSGGSGPARVVIGSAEHKGVIRFDDPAPFTGDLTLQNGGAGSGGIELGSDVTVSGQLTLSSGGTVAASDVAYGGPTITASSLLLHGARPESNFQLALPGNRIDGFAATFDTPGGPLSGQGGVDLSNDGALAVRALSGAGFSSAGNAATVIGAPETVVAGDLVLDTTGNLTLASNVATRSGDITLVSGGVFLNPDNNQLAAGAGGSWRVFADTWVGEVRGTLAPSRPYPNYYGCTYGSECAASIGGSHFFYRERPLLTITPNAATREYGDADPILGYSGTGLVNDDTLADAALGGYASTSPLAASIGNYATTGAFTSPVGYRISAGPGNLTVTPATILVSVDDKAKQYGAPDPALSASLSGFKLDDTAAVVSGLALSTATGTLATAGTHAIVGANANAANYNFIYQPGVLTVGKASLQILIDDKRKTYGDADPLLSARYAGFQYGDDASVLSGLRLSTATGAGATAGMHAITGAGTDAANYTVTYRPGTLTVDKALLLVKADDKSKVYGDADPALTATMSGFRYDDTASVVSGMRLSTASGAQAGVGTHPIVVIDASADNYALRFVPGVLTVDPAVLSYVATPMVQLQNTPAQPLSGSLTGFAYGDTLANATTGTLSFSTATTPRSPAGRYAIQGGGLSAANYRFVQADSNETALTVLASPVELRPAMFREVTFESSNVYEKNFGTPHLCVGTGPLGTGAGGADGNDMLALEWSRVRVSPNLSNCLGLGQRNSCSDF